MIKLVAKAKHSYRKEHVFYFHNMDDCNTFKEVFRDYWCKIQWDKPVEIPNDTKIEYSERKAMDKDPKERAESNLSWGFSLEKGEGWDKRTSSQNTFINSFIDRLNV